MVSKFWWRFQISDRSFARSLASLTYCCTCAEKPPVSTRLMYGLLFNGVRLTSGYQTGERLLDVHVSTPSWSQGCQRSNVPAANVDLAKEFAASADAAYSGYCGPLSAYCAHHHLTDIGPSGGTVCEGTYRLDEESAARNVSTCSAPRALASQ